MGRGSKFWLVAMATADPSATRWCVGVGGLRKILRVMAFRPDTKLGKRLASPHSKKPGVIASMIRGSSARSLSVLATSQAAAILHGWVVEDRVVPVVCAALCRVECGQQSLRRTLNGMGRALDSTGTTFEETCAFHEQIVRRTENGKAMLKLLQATDPASRTESPKLGDIFSPFCRFCARRFKKVLGRHLLSDPQSIAALMQILQTGTVVTETTMKKSEEAGGSSWADVPEEAALCAECVHFLRLVTAEDGDVRMIITFQALLAIATQALQGSLQQRDAVLELQVCVQQLVGQGPVAQKYMREASAGAGEAGHLTTVLRTLRCVFGALALQAEGSAWTSGLHVRPAAPMNDTLAAFVMKAGSEALGRAGRDGVQSWRAAKVQSRGGLLEMVCMEVLPCPGLGPLRLRAVEVLAGALAAAEEKTLASLTQSLTQTQVERSAMDVLVSILLGSEEVQASLELRASIEVLLTTVVSSADVRQVLLRPCLEEASGQGPAAAAGSQMLSVLRAADRPKGSAPARGSDGRLAPGGCRHLVCGTLADDPALPAVHSRPLQPLRLSREWLVRALLGRMLGPEIAIPPMWDGLRPESTLKRYLKELDLWEAVTEIPKAKGAVKVYQALSGTVKEAVESLSVAELTSEDGVKQIRRKRSFEIKVSQELESMRKQEDEPNFDDYLIEALGENDTVEQDKVLREGLQPDRAGDQDEDKVSHLWAVETLVQRMSKWATDHSDVFRRPFSFYPFFGEQDFLLLGHRRPFGAQLLCGTPVALAGRRRRLGWLPVGLSGVPTVAADNVPLLIPVNLLRALKDQVDLGGNFLHMPAIGASCHMQVLSSGHPAVDVTDFGAGWVLPTDCPDKSIESEFRLSPSETSETSSQTSDLGPSAWLAAGGGASDARRESSSCSRRWVAMAGDTASHDNSYSRAPAKRTRPPKLARHLGQALLAAILGTASAGGWPMVAPRCSGPDACDHGSTFGFDFGNSQACSYQERPGLPQPPRAKEARAAFQDKGVATVEPGACLPTPRGGPQRTAALFTGRALVENSEPVPETKTLVQAVTEQALASKEAAHNMEMGDLMEQLVRQRRTIEEMQAQVDLVTGRCAEFEMAGMDSNVGTMAVVEEFRRIREMEEPRELLPHQGDQGRVGERGQQPENRGAAFPFPFGDPGAEEQGGPRDGLRGLSLEPRSASGTVVLKKASFEMLRPSVAGSTGNPAIEDYVVTRLGNSLVRRDRRDFEKQGFRDQGCLDNEAKLWDQWSQSAPRVLWLKAGGTKPGAEMALRMSRAHAARKLPFLIEAGTGRPATKVLQSACQSSASYLLFRKQGMITNFPDSLKYDFAHAPRELCKGLCRKGEQFKSIRFLWMFNRSFSHLSWLKKRSCNPRPRFVCPLPMKRKAWESFIETWLVLQRGDGSGVLRDSLAVVDAKSVFDNVTKEGAQAEDKYTALEVAIARERADGLGVQFR
ncbi:C15C7.7 [Symbiodinium sp. KB8]|nr:C15C7.7 [Symbiodinium sp. KB8]